MKKIVTFVVLVIIISSGGIYLYTANKKDISTKTEIKETATLAPQIENIIDQQISLLKTLVLVTEIIEETKKSNEINKNTSLEDILAIDKTWRESMGISQFTQMFLENKTATHLLEFQKKNPGFKEIFVADAFGLNVGQTEKTSDYYQADEDWWIKSFNEGKGRTFHGDIEFDDSSQTEAISIYLPIIDPASGEVHGVLKGVFDLSVIKNLL
ncbi:MAG: hypothetical protein AB200_01235 [Parcubacteria bacterium C7867-005]|nr:MAG: hypothetical protein AB200_01235 [Parcubacteria bacterium C7867-005]